MVAGVRCHAGSSPRARGTLGQRRGVRLGFRFIRERGERCCCSVVCAMIGSSPRARGTRPRSGAAHQRWPVHPRARGERLRCPGGGSTSLRFIPASAGNAYAGEHSAASSGSSPRARGTLAAMRTAGRRDGSSPRARGTRPETVRAAQSGRFIPASAGNARSASSHAARDSGLHDGSSPRARGTPVAELHPERAAVHPRERGERAAAATPRCCQIRFIPASAGNATVGHDTVAVAVHPRERGERVGARAAPCTTPVHPRERGERAGSVCPLSCHGSSPRARGTRQRSRLRAARGSSPRARGTPLSRCEPLPARFIPASAGNARPTAAARPAVHPRERGERAAAACRCSARGSSPRARGTQAASWSQVTAARFIPASAGNADTRPTTVRRDDGSSPRARGTPHSRSEPPERFIPARAGNACIAAAIVAKTVHPRERGERALGILG